MPPFVGGWGPNRAHTQSNSSEFWPELVDDAALASRRACLKKAFPNPYANPVCALGAAQASGCGNTGANISAS